MKEFVNPYYKNKDIMHDLSHIERVLKYVEKLLKEGKYEADIDILIYSAYFHGFIYNSEERIIQWLQEQGLSREKISKIIKVSWESQKDNIAETLEGKILHDAHMIEGGKTYLVVKSLITGSVRGQTLEETIRYIEENVLNKGTCYLQEAKTIFKNQQEFAKQFIKDLKEGLQ
ncbi:hypothetical protein [Clostridium sp. UBA6640]|uniref:hypothetical protein n=1 Tax=Clostridium sp. UBA6640 TaxID=1946370 RepID=UPI0025B8E10E|nr:hypothetical protein [Clostridium sp. UBA6640]